MIGAYDLEMKLLVNKTKKMFIVSDNPAVKYNQFLEKRNHPGGHLGIFTKGLQLFIPLSPSLMLVYFDKWAYKYGNKKEKIILIKNEVDIDQLNYLQFMNCYKIIFTKQLNQFYLNQLALKAKKKRSIDFTELKEVKRFIDDEGLEHIQYIGQGINNGFNMALSFIRQPQPAKDHVLDDFVVQLRDERMRNYGRH
nr:DUF4238 domain-containing protein [Marivirga aurantiaca]